MSIIKIEDIAHVRFTAPDLGVMATFMQEFGLVPELAADGVLYARGAGTAPFIHATAQGEPGFAGLGLRAASVADLEILARHAGVAVEGLATPGGGSVVRLTDPDGNLVEVVAGQAAVAARAVAFDQLRNTAGAKPRQRQGVRLSAGASTVLRLGHAVLGVKDFRVAEAWYKSHFGFITSDEIEVAPGMAIGAFLRCDRGATLTDHHSVFLLQSPDAPAFMHAAFEVSNLDDLMLGHTHLLAAQRKPAWGVGRHILGSQIFDYWLDPWGHELEHWTDGDLFTAADGSNTATLDDLLAVQWGAQHPLFAATPGEAV
jgi:catechol 2,3-dioxygenase-like lactoylglutathione lyase family enzyme